MSVVSIRLNEIVSNDNRKYTKDPDFVKLLKSVRRVGVVQMPVVRKAEDGKYHIVAGRRRIAALRIVHEDNPSKEIVCDQLLDVGDATPEEIALIENVNRLEMHPLDEAALFQGLADKGESVKEIAEYYARSPSEIYKRLRLNTLIDELKTGFRDGILDLAGAGVLAELPEGDQKNFYVDNFEDYFDIGGALEDRDDEDEDDEDIRIPEDVIRQFVYKSQKYKIKSCMGDGCKECRKRTHNENNSLFFEYRHLNDVCLDSDCYRTKWQELLQKELAEKYVPGSELMIYFKSEFNGGVPEQLYKKATHVEFDINRDGPTRFEVLKDSKYEFVETTRKKNICYQIGENRKGGITIQCVGYNEKQKAPAKTTETNTAKAKADPDTKLVNEYGRELMEAIAADRAISPAELAKALNKTKTNNYELSNKIGEIIYNRITSERIEKEKAGAKPINYMDIFMRALDADFEKDDYKDSYTGNYSKKQKQWLLDILGYSSYEDFDISDGTQKLFHFLLLTYGISRDVPNLEDLKDIENEEYNYFWTYASMTKEEYKSLYIEVAKEVINKALPKSKAKVIKAEKAAAPHGKGSKKAASGTAEEPEDDPDIDMDDEE